MVRVMKKFALADVAICGCENFATICVCDLAMKRFMLFIIVVLLFIYV